MYGAPERADPRHRLVRHLLARTVLVCAAALVAIVATAPSALADAAGPTDYRTEILAIEPGTSSIRIEMIGGDAFVSLEQLEPVEVIVVGYQGEPYLRFHPSGTVLENQRSPAVWLNQDRYGTDDERPAFYDAQAPPQWTAVAENGRYAWHDHRSHWMSSEPAPGWVPGEKVFDAVLPLQVDGRKVTVTVGIYLLEGPSPLPTVGGLVAGAALAGLALRSGRLVRALAALTVAAGAMTLGLIAVRSVPAETEPSRLLWLLPLMALGAAAALALLRNRTATTVYLDGLAVAAGATLAAWAYFRLDALWRALIPSDAPAALDRATITIAMVTGVAVAAQGLYGLVRPQRLIEVNAEELV